MALSTAEIIGITVVSIALAAATVVICLRCCNSMAALAEDANQATKAKRAKALVRQVGVNVRASFRKARNSFRGRGRRQQTTTRQTAHTPTVSERVDTNRSELHPSYLTNKPSSSGVPGRNHTNIHKDKPRSTSDYSHCGISEKTRKTRDPLPPPPPQPPPPYDPKTDAKTVPVQQSVKNLIRPSPATIQKQISQLKAVHNEPERQTKNLTPATSSVQQTSPQPERGDQAKKNYAQNTKSTHSKPLSKLRTSEGERTVEPDLGAQQPTIKAGSQYEEDDQGGFLRPNGSHEKRPSNENRSSEPSRHEEADDLRIWNKDYPQERPAHHPGWQEPSCQPYQNVPAQPSGYSQRPGIQHQPMLLDPRAYQIKKPETRDIYHEPRHMYGEAYQHRQYQRGQNVHREPVYDPRLYPDRSIHIESNPWGHHPRVLQDRQFNHHPGPHYPSYPPPQPHHMGHDIPRHRPPGVPPQHSQTHNPYAQGHRNERRDREEYRSRDHMPVRQYQPRATEPRWDRYPGHQNSSQRNTAHHGYIDNHQRRQLYKPSADTYI